MKTALILLLTFGGLSFAGEPTLPAPGQAPQGREVKKLTSVTWDVDSQKLVWVVQTGSMVNGKFVPRSEQKYVISPDEASMAVEAEKRGFDQSEAQSLSHLLDVLSLYCAESVEWWDQGQGTPLSPNAKPASPATPVNPTSPANPTRQPAQPKANPPASGNPVRVGQPQPKAPKHYKVPDSDMVASLRSGN